MTLFRGCRCLQDEAEVVSWRKVPGTVLLHDEGEVLGVVVRVVGEDVEHHSQIKFVQFILRDGELPTGGKEIFIAICFGIDCGERLGEHLLTGTAVKPLCQEMADTFHLDQAGRHHRDSGPGGQVIPGFLDLRDAELGGIELEDVILPVASCRGLAGEDVSTFVHRDDGFLEASTGGCSDGHQGLLRECLFRGDDGVLAVLLDLLRQIVQFRDHQPLIRTEGIFAAGDEFERTHGAATDEGELRQGCLVFLVVVMFCEPLVKEGVAPIVRKRVRNERGEFLILCGVRVAIDGETGRGALR